ncbi:MAG: NTP transferase domain-containing protein [Haloarculaceae archaeon]
MCGGRGTRLDREEKPLVEVGGVPMVERVRRALVASNVERVYAVTAPHAPGTAAFLDCPRIEAPGEGYVPDLQHALADDRVAEPVVTVAADVPLLTPGTVDRALDAAAGATTVAVPVGRKRALGVTVDTAFRAGGRLLAPSGLNVVGAGAGLTVATDRGLAVNVNRPRDLRRARWLAASD